MGIVENLAKILSSRYGRDVRQAIHDSIEEGYNIAVNAQTAAVTAQNSAANSAIAAGNSASAANDSKVAAAGSAAEAKHYAESIGGALRPMGTITFSQLPAVATATDGDCYNISDAFTTTSDFEEGAGVKVPAGANVYKTVGGKWDVLAGAYVTGVKGSAEANYRTGEVEITKADIGLGDVPNTDFTAPVSTLNEDVAWYGTSSTAAATSAKTATTSDSKFSLVTGAKVKIKFTNANTAASPTLNVDSKGAISIKAYGTTAPTLWWSAGDVVEFTYDGTNWIMGACGSQIYQLNSDLSTKATPADIANANVWKNANIDGTGDTTSDIVNIGIIPNANEVIFVIGGPYNFIDVPIRSFDIPASGVQYRRLSYYYDSANYAYVDCAFDNSRNLSVFNYTHVEGGVMTHAFDYHTFYR